MVEPRVIVETARLRVREWTGDDAPAHAALVGEGAERDLRSTLRRYRLHGFGMWCLERLEDARIVGECGLQLITGTLDVEIGFLLAPEFRGRGYATEAARAVLAHGFEELGARRIIAVADPENRASIGVLARIGMTFEKLSTRKGREGVVYSARRARDGGPTG